MSAGMVPDFLDDKMKARIELVDDALTFLHCLKHTGTVVEMS
jgi:hypothetical protein